MTVIIAEPWRYVPWHEPENALVPLFCDWDNRPMGFAALFLARMWASSEAFCSDECRVMAEWHAPERR